MKSYLRRKTYTFFKKPKTLLILVVQFLSPLMGDKLYIKMLFMLRTGYPLNLKNPITFNEKLQWLKLNYRTPIQTKMVDKFEVKEYIKDIIGEEYVIPSLGVWDSFEEIDFNTLPDQFVLKTTHDQGGVIICTDKKKFNYALARSKMKKHLKRNFYLKYREWPYKNVKPRIIAEKFIGNGGNVDLKDFKFYCFDGVPKVLFIASGRSSEDKKFDFYDISFNHLPIKRAGTIHSVGGNEKPINYDLMISLAEKLSDNFPHVRVDFYNIEGVIFFGELTFFTGSGMKAFYPKKWDYVFGDFLNLPSLKK